MRVLGVGRGLRAHALLVIALVCAAIPLRAQQVDRDSLRGAYSPRTASEVWTANTDDSTVVSGDTTFVFPVKDAVDTLVTYVAKDSVVYRLKDKKMTLSGATSIEYGAMSIQAERLVLDWDSSTIHAEGVPDTAAGRAGKSLGRPKLKDGGGDYEGEAMTYNFRTKRGIIVEGETAIDDGFYRGERIKRADQNTYFIGNGEYSTCDNPDHKHYYFGSPKMKFVPKDVIIAEPIIFYVEDIPLFILPFAVIPSKGGRSSGIIIPAFGDDYARGRYLRGGGYYLAASDYWDATLTGDIYSKGGYRLSLGLDYALRYNFSGSFDASYGRQTFLIGSPYSPDDKPRTDYSFSLRHNQDLDPTSTLTADVSFMTDSYYQSFSNDLDQLLTQSVRSAASYSTSWEGTNRSLSVNISRDQDLRNGTSTNVLPDVSFNQSQIFPFRREGSAGEGAWYEMIGFNYSGRFRNTIDVLKRTEYGENDTTDITKSYNRRGISHNIGLISSPKLGYITVQPSFSITERWYDHRVERFFNAADSTVAAREQRGFFALHAFQASLSASTKLYGTLSPNIGGVIGVRHTLQPSLSYSYHPDFSSPGWGMYQSYLDSLGRAVRYDPYTGHADLPGEVFGGVGSGESQTLGWNVSNIFEMKLSPAEDDTTETPRKFQLLNLNFGSSYNFVRDSLRMAAWSMNFRTSVGSLLDIYGGATFSPYAFQRQRYGIDSTGRSILIESGREINTYLLSTGQGLARLTAFDFHLSTSLSQDLFSSGTKDTSAASPGGGYSYRIPWSLNLGFDYAMSQFDPDAKTRSASMRASMSISPTPGWRVSASTYYDIVAKQIGTPSISVTRDLHCWEMMFDWVPTGIYRHFSLVIRLKAPQLQDIKLERKGSDRGVY